MIELFIYFAILSLSLIFTLISDNNYISRLGFTFAIFSPMALVTITESPEIHSRHVLWQPSHSLYTVECLSTMTVHPETLRAGLPSCHHGSFQAYHCNKIQPQEPKRPLASPVQESQYKQVFQTILNQPNSVCYPLSADFCRIR